MLLCRGATVYAASIAMPNIRRSLHNANLFAIAMASRRCVGRKAHLYLQIGTVMQQNVAMPRRYSICGKHCDAEYTKEPAQCKLVCNCNGFSQMCGPQGTLISPNMIPMQQNVALPRRYSICGKLSAAEYTKEPEQCKLVCNCNGFSQLRVPQGNRISPNRMRAGNRDCSAEALQYMRQAKRSRIYEGA